MLAEGQQGVRGDVNGRTHSVPRHPSLVSVSLVTLHPQRKPQKPAIVPILAQAAWAPFLGSLPGGRQVKMEAQLLLQLNLTVPQVEWCKSPGVQQSFHSPQAHAVRTFALHFAFDSCAQPRPWPWREPELASDSCQQGQAGWSRELHHLPLCCTAHGNALRICL